jgi:hypothetical protein
MCCNAIGFVACAVLIVLKFENNKRLMYSAVKKKRHAAKLGVRHGPKMSDLCQNEHYSTSYIAMILYDDTMIQ